MYRYRNPFKTRIALDYYRSSHCGRVRVTIHQLPGGGGAKVNQRLAPVLLVRYEDGCQYLERARLTTFRSGTLGIFGILGDGHIGARTGEGWGG